MPSAESGSGKSETFRHAAKPFFAIEREMVERWEAEVLPSFQAEKEMLESEIGKLKKDASKGKTGMEREEIKNEMQAKKKALADVDAMLIAPALCCEDVTTEKLAVMLGHNQEQLASLSPDAGSIVNNLLGRYSKLDRTDEGIYLKAFSGDNCRVDRQGREPVLLQRPCLAALWLVQPDKIETLLGKSELTDGGMIPRLLVCHTRAMPISEDGQTGLLVSTSRSLKTGAVRKLHEDAAIWWAKNTNVVRTRTGISSRCSLARLAMLPGTDLTILVNTRAPAPLRLGRI